MIDSQSSGLESIPSVVIGCLQHLPVDSHVLGQPVSLVHQGHVFSSLKFFVVPFFDKGTDRVVDLIDGDQKDLVFFFEMSELHPMKPTYCTMKFKLRETAFDERFLDDLVDSLAYFAVLPSHKLS